MGEAFALLDAHVGWRLRRAQRVEKTGVDRGGGAAAAGAQVVERGVDRDAMDVRRERGVAAETGQGAVQRHEHVLREVLALGDRPQDARQPAEHGVDVRAVDRGERVLVAVLEARDHSSSRSRAGSTTAGSNSAASSTRLMA